MKLSQFSHNQRARVGFALLFVLVFALVLGSAANMPVALAQATSTPTPTNTPTITPTPTVTPFPVSRVNQAGGTWLCRSSAIDCLQSLNGGGIHFYGSNGALTFSVVPSTGNIVTTGSLTVNSIVVSTPNIHCTTQTVGTSGVATLVPYYATPLAPVVSIGQALTADGNKVDAVNSAGVVTIHTYNNAAIPTPATTPVVVNICVSKG